ncbi:MAG: Omp28-related outer membrane protein [Chitinophagaceae bacterium]
MKRLLFILFAAAMLISCQEKGPIINFGAKPFDTSFMAAPETANPRMVLVEEFTGVTCPNCPLGQQALVTLEAAHPGQLAIMSLEIFGQTQTNPVNENGVKTINDNRTQAGTDLSSGIYGANNSIPIAGIDRVPLSGAMLIGRGSWASQIDTRVNTPSPANISMISSYDASSKKVTLKVHVAYTSSVIVGQKLTVALIESGVIDAQVLPYSPNPADPTVNANYVHNHVLRDILTSPVGDALLGDKSTKVAGQVYERTFVYTIPPNVLNLDNCQFVAFVANDNAGDKEVVQAAVKNLK